MTTPSLAMPPVSRPTRPDAAQLRGISRRYAGRWLQGYVHGKLRSDPVYAAAAGEIAVRPAPVLDVGCGIDLLAHTCKPPDAGSLTWVWRSMRSRSVPRDSPCTTFPKPASRQVPAKPSCDGKDTFCCLTSSIISTNPFNTRSCALHGPRPGCFWRSRLCSGARLSTVICLSPAAHRTSRPEIPGP